MNVTQLKAQDYQTCFSAFVVVCQFNSTVWTYMLTQLIFEGFKSRLPLLFSFSFLCFLYSNLIFFISEKPQSWSSSCDPITQFLCTLYSLLSSSSPPCDLHFLKFHCNIFIWDSKREKSWLLLYFYIYQEMNHIIAVILFVPTFN